MASSSRKEIAGIVILYNPEIEFIDNIASYIGQVERLFVFDNSTNKDSYAALSEKDILKCNKIDFISFNENRGVAYALNYAAERAIEFGYDYLLTMDQDSKAPPDLVSKLYPYFKKIPRAAIISPSHTNKFNTQPTYNEEYLVCSSVKTSGNLIDLKVLKRVGYFKTEYFIDFVDIEICYRLLKNNYKIIQINQVSLIHNEADISIKIFFGRKVYPYNHNPIRMYYKARNLLYLRKEYKDIFPDLLKSEYREFLTNLAKIILYEKNKMSKIRFIMKGLFDFLNGKTGSI